MDTLKNFVLEKVVVTHEFHSNQTAINIGTCRWQGREKRVAVKTSNDTSTIQHEAKVLRLLGHYPNIVNLLDHGYGYLVLNGVKHGLTVAEWKGDTCMQERIRMLKELAVALNYVHKSGIIHHDVNPYNVLVEYDTCVRLVLCDFGVAEITYVGKEEYRTMGRLGYVAPEQSDGRTEPITNKIDVYGFSTVMLSVLTAGRTELELQFYTPVRVLKLMEECRCNDPKERPDMEMIVKELSCPDLYTTVNNAIRTYRLFDAYESRLKEGRIFEIPVELKDSYAKLLEYNKETVKKAIGEHLSNCKCPKEYRDCLKRFFTYMQCTVSRVIYDYESIWMWWNETEEMIEMWFGNLGVCMFIEEVDDDEYESKNIPIPKTLEERVHVSFMVRDRRTSHKDLWFYDFLPKQEHKALTFLVGLQEYCREYEYRDKEILNKLYESVITPS